MPLLSVLQFPDPKLRTKAKHIATVDDAIRKIVADMFETMYEQGGVGLAATQVDVHQRIIVMDISETRNEPLCVINPEIIHREGVQHEMEGCLSFPSVFEKVERAAKIRLCAQDQHGKEFEMDADGLLAVCIQHEMDHLDGVLFIDHLSRLRQERARKKLDKIRRRTF